ncbi:phospholipase-like protein, partial [Tanacetum coccineum]
LSYRSDERVFEVFFQSCFYFYPLRYVGGQILDLRLSRSKSLEQGLTIVESDRDVEKIFEMANLHRTLEVYIGHIPQAPLAGYYFKNMYVFSHIPQASLVGYYSKNMCVVEFDEEEQEEAQSPSYLRSPHVRQRTSVIHGKSNVLLDNFEDVGNDLSLKDGLISTTSDGDPAVRGSSYIRKLIDDVSEDDDFKSGLWVTTLEFINDVREIWGGCFGNIKSYLENGKLEKVVAVITSCTPNVIGDMNVTLKDPLGTMSGTIHHKVLLDDGYLKAIKVGSTLILHNDTIAEHIDGASGNKISYEETLSQMI